MPIIASNFKTNHTRKSTALFINEVNDYLKNQNIKKVKFMCSPLQLHFGFFDTVSNFTIGAQNALCNSKRLIYR